jgi:predicted AAA+ superfamily ATPase
MEIQRILFKTLQTYLIPNKVNILFGARRVGKTFLLKKIVSEMEFSTLWLNGEDIEIQNMLAVRSIANYKRLTANKELIIIDEAQVIPNIGAILKLMIDEIPTLRIIASGSSAFDLGNKLGEPLVGRAFWHELFPVAQIELNLYENYIETLRNLEERLLYGAYPEIFTLPSIEQKEEYLRDLVNSYLLKDIISFEGVRNSAKIYDLLKLLSFQVGKEVSLQELGNQLGMSKNTVEKYLDLLEKVYVLKRVGAYSKNLRKEISKSSRWYFWDNGIRNAIIGDFRPIKFRSDIGELWENYLITERFKKNKYQRNYAEAYFWRTYDQQEIDYLEVKNQEIHAFEFKWNSTKKAKVPKAFAEGYPDASFEVITQQNYLEFIQ